MCQRFAQSTIDSCLVSFLLYGIVVVSQSEEYDIFYEINDCVLIFINIMMPQLSITLSVSPTRFSSFAQSTIYSRLVSFLLSRIVVFSLLRSSTQYANSFL